MTGMREVFLVCVDGSGPVEPHGQKSTHPIPGRTEQRSDMFPDTCAELPAAGACCLLRSPATSAAGRLAPSGQTKYSGV